MGGKPARWWWQERDGGGSGARWKGEADLTVWTEVGGGKRWSVAICPSERDNDKVLEVEECVGGIYCV
jgi:hypothetical protein